MIYFLRRASTDQSASKSNKEHEDHVLTQLDHGTDQEPMLSLPNGDGTFRGLFQSYSFSYSLLNHFQDSFLFFFISMLLVDI